MLHSTLPRAFLAPGLGYFGYYGDDHHPYAVPPPPPPPPPPPSTTTTTTTWHIPMEDPYTRIPALQSWESVRSSTPCPLDLSLKPPPTPSTPRAEETIEVDDEEDRRIREAVQRRLEAQRCRRDSIDERLLVVDDGEMSPRSSSVLSHRSYEFLPAKQESSPDRRDAPEKIYSPQESVTRLPPYTVAGEVGQKYQVPIGQGLLLSSPTRLPSYHSQLLLTPSPHNIPGINAPMTPPSTPSPPQCPQRRRPREDEDVASPSETTTTTSSSSSSSVVAGSSKQSTSTERSSSGVQRPKKKHARRLKFDEDTSSPVSGTVILGPDEAVVTGDIDPAFNIVEVTEEARAELAKIENRLGPYQCKLCRQLHDDAFQLAQHRCSRIAHVEYRCPECDKRFSCPANLASHRRWHKPRLPNNPTSTATSSSSSSSNSSSSSSPASANPEIACTRCAAKFTRQAALRKHLATQHPESNNNNNSSSSNNNNNNNNNVLVDGSEQMAKIEAAQMNVMGAFATETP